MTQFHSQTPSQAIEMIEEAGVKDAAKLIRDRAAAGLIKTYAAMQVTIAVDGERTAVRDGAVAVELWERMVVEGVDCDVWNGGTVRLAGSDLIGGAPAVHITGITFHPEHIQRLADRQRPRHSGTSPPGRPAAEPMAVVVPVEPASAQRVAPDATAIPPGAILCTIKQAGAALGFGRTKVHELIKATRLERVEVDGGVRITVASVMALAGMP